MSIILPYCVAHCWCYQPFGRKKPPLQARLESFLWINEKKSIRVFLWLFLVRNVRPRKDTSWHLMYMQKSKEESNAFLMNQLVILLSWRIHDTMTTTTNYIIQPFTESFTPNFWWNFSPRDSKILIFSIVE